MRRIRVKRPGTTAFAGPEDKTPAHSVIAGVTSSAPCPLPPLSSIAHSAFRLLLDRLHRGKRGRYSPHESLRLTAEARLRITARPREGESSSACYWEVSHRLS